MSMLASGILASAGTGKTYALTTELLKLLLAGHPPESIFAATFTRNAAGEILDRVLRRTCDAARDGESLAELARAVERPDLTRERCHQLAATLARSLDRLLISTLDAFMGRIATAFSVELGLPPSWRISGDDEDAIVRRAAISRVLREGGAATILPLLRMLKKSEGVRSVRESLSGVISAVHHVHTQSSPGAWEKIAPTSPPLDTASLSTVIESLRACQVPRTKAGAPNTRWEKAHRKAIECITTGDWLEFIRQTLVDAAIDGRMFSQVPFPETMAEVYRELARHAQSTLITELSFQNLAARRIAERFDTAYTDLKSERGGVRFEDIPRMLLAEDLTQVRDELYYRLDARIQHILLDEFQDTSVSQFGVIEPLIAEIISDETRSRSLFYVGDAKQSLYGWRDAQPKLLAHLGEHWPQIDVRRLSMSYRSAPEVLRAVNAVFLQLQANPAMTSPGAALAAREWKDLFAEHTWADTLAGTPGKVVLRQFPAPSEEDAASPSSPGEDDQDQLALSNCRFIAARIAEIRRQAPSATIGVLMRTKSSIPRLLMTLAELGIDASEEGGSPLVQSPAVAAIAALLRLAERPGDTMAAFHVATTALGEHIRLDREVNPATCAGVSAEVRDQLTRQGFASVLGAWAHWLAPVCVEMDRTRLWQMVEAAEDYDARGGVSIGEFLELLETIRRPSGRSASVRVMTIHASKGLEFDAVILPELDGRIPSRLPEVLFDRDSLLGPISRISLYAADAVQRGCPALAEMALSRNTREIRESLCVLYVAMTRARRCLEMIISKPPETSKSLRLAYIVRHALAAAAPTAHDGEASAEPPPDDILWSSGSDRWHDGLDTTKKGGAPASSISAPPPPTEITLGLSPGRAGAASISPSDLTKASDAAHPSTGAPSPLTSDRELLRRRRAARGLGTGVHACFELATWLEDGLPTEAQLRSVLSTINLPLDIEVSRVIAAFRRQVALPEIAGLLRRSRHDHSVAAASGSVTLYRELPAQMIDPASHRMIRAKIDRIVLLSRDGKPVSAEIIDWKTDGLLAAPETIPAPLSHTDLLASAESYRPQIDSYRTVISRMFNLSSSAITGTLAFVATGQIATLPPIP